MTALPVDKLITLDEAAEVLSVNERTVRRMIAAGRLPGYRVGPRLVRVKLEDVLDLIVPMPAAEWEAAR